MRTKINNYLNKWIEYNLKFILTLALFLTVNIGFPQKQLSVKDKKEVIDKVIEIFNKYYPLEDVAIKMTNNIDKNLKDGIYNQFNTIEDFTKQLTHDLRLISNDYHIRIIPYEEIPSDLQKEIKLGTPIDNYGFKKVEILEGNIGYIELTSFINSQTAGETAIAAINFIANCEALIIDLRKNGGGDEDMAMFLSSYFFLKSVHLTDFYYRFNDSTKQVWSQSFVPGKRLSVIPLYILLSKYSYSSAEVFAYQLQQLKRATIVGEKTRGGVHGVRYMSFPKLNINMKVPYSRDINPYTQTNYITGIIPDIPADSKIALKIASIEAAKKLLQTKNDSLKQYKLNWLVSYYQTDINPVDISIKQLNAYEGKYANDSVKISCNKLIYVWKDGTEHEMVYMGSDMFKYKEPEELHYRVQFIRNKYDKIIAFYEFDSDLGFRYELKKRESKINKVMN